MEYGHEADGQCTRSVIETYLSVHSNTVSLTELNPVYDESGHLDDTALALEHLRYELSILQCLMSQFPTIIQSVENSAECRIKLVCCRQVKGVFALDTRLTMP